MESIEAIIRKASQSLKSVDNFRDLANKIINNYHIKCGNKGFRFAEIEFYYYDKNHFNEEWCQKTYPRKDKDAGELFFHYSGVDICFDSSFDKDMAIFGGILIRSLYDEERKMYITGPLLCANEMLNACSKNMVWPVIEETIEHSCVIEATGRYGISYSDGYEFKDKLCFYDHQLKVHLINSIEASTWDYKTESPKKVTRNYSKRFLNAD